MWNIDFISEENFINNIKEAINSYLNTMNDVDLDDFNKNIIDPIKLLFDMKVYNKTTDELIEDEINRQIDKTHSNAIGYFNQNMFKYIDNCVVPEVGFDIIYTDPIDNKKYYIEMKNKHNTMNDNAKIAVFEKMNNKLNQEPDSICMLVEVISGKSKNEVWNYKNNTDERIRRVSIDNFYYLVTKDETAFRKVCDILPLEIDKALLEMSRENNQNILALDQLKEINPDIIKSLFKLAFDDYKGFGE